MLRLCHLCASAERKQRGNKFQPRVKQGIFFGYGLGSNEYKVYFPSENIAESKHLTKYNLANLLKKSNALYLQRFFSKWGKWNFYCYNEATTKQDNGSSTNQEPNISSTPTNEEK